METDISQQLTLMHEMPIPHSTVKSVEFDSTMTWEPHMEQLTKRVNSSLIQHAKTDTDKANAITSPFKAAIFHVSLGNSLLETSA